MRPFVETIAELLASGYTEANVELKQQDYSGKRVFVSIRDTAEYAIQYKLDIGVHTIETARQNDMEFDLTRIGFGSTTLLANAPEQVFVEKLKSLLRLGSISSRGKDIFDMVYLASVVDVNVMKRLMDAYIYSDKRMFERNVADVVRRLTRVFMDRGFMAMLANPRMNWLKLSPQEATEKLAAFMRKLA